MTVQVGCGKLQVAGGKLQVARCKLQVVPSQCKRSPRFKHLLSVNDLSVDEQRIAINAR